MTMAIVIATTATTTTTTTSTSTTTHYDDHHHDHHWYHEASKLAQLNHLSVDVNLVVLSILRLGVQNRCTKLEVTEVLLGVGSHPLIPRVVYDAVPEQCVCVCCVCVCVCVCVCACVCVCVCRALQQNSAQK
jgi:hypothetical protein